MTDAPQQPDAEPDLVAIREQVYVDSRSQEELQRFYDRPMHKPPGLTYTAVRVVTALYVWIVFRTRTRDAHLVPTSGPLIFAPNHFSNIDHFFLGAATRRKVQFMAKSQLYKGLFGEVMLHGGVFPVQRGKGDEQSVAVARAILARGGSICVYSEGGRSRTGRLADRAKRGIGRIALESGATVVPVAIHGSQRVRNWRRLQLPRVTVRYGEPLRWEAIAAPTRQQQQAAADAIFAEIRRLYDSLEPAAPPPPAGSPSASS